jgi:hypothetical protein
MKKLLCAALLASLTLACGGSQSSDANEKLASSLSALKTTSTQSFTAADCNAFAVNGTVRICHATDSTTSPLVAIDVDTAGCVNGHSKHAGDYIAAAVNDPNCQGVCNLNGDWYAPVHYCAGRNQSGLATFVQNGTNLVLTNECGTQALDAKLTATGLTSDWPNDPGITATISSDCKTITWSNGTIWERP